MATLTLQPSAAAGIDTYLNSSSANNNYGVTTTLAIGQGSGDIRRTLIYFDISSIPAGATITSAILTLECTSVFDSNSRDANIYRSLVQWYEGDANGGAPSGDGSTWNERNYNGSVAWSGGAGGASGTEYYATPTDTTAITTTGPYTWDLTTDVQDFVDGTYTNYGWWLLGSEGTSFHGKSFDSSDGATPSQRPELEVIYDFYINGTSDGTSTVEGTLLAIGYLVGTSDGTSTVEGILVSEQIQGTSDGTSTVTGTVHSNFNLLGEIDGTSTVTGDPVGIGGIVGESNGTSTVTGLIDYVHILYGTSNGTSTVTGTAWGKYTLVVNSIKFSTPLLYLTDGTTKSNGQQNRFNLISPKCIFKVQDWRPITLGYKDGGYWNDSPIATGRRLVSRSYGNIIEVFELIARSNSQDELIYQFNQLYRWLESAADYWVGDWTVRPVYLVSRSPYETNERYAIVHHGSVPELENPYRSPFFTNGSRSGAVFRTLTLRLEHGIWQDNPPGQSTEVAISSYRSYTVTGWSS